MEIKSEAVRHPCLIYFSNPALTADNDAMNKANTIDGIIRMFRKRTTDGCTASGSKGTRPND